MQPMKEKDNLFCCYRRKWRWCWSVSFRYREISEVKYLQRRSLLYLISFLLFQFQFLFKSFSNSINLQGLANNFLSVFSHFATYMSFIFRTFHFLPLSYIISKLMHFFLGFVYFWKRNQPISQITLILSN